MRTALNKLIPYWPLLYVGLLLIADLLYSELATLPVDGLTINYTLLSFYQASAFIVPLIALNGIVVFVFHFVSARSWGGRPRNRANLLAIILFVGVAIPFSFQATIAWESQLETSTFTPQTQVSLHNEFYRLAFIGGKGFGGYNLYRCDSLGFSCTRVLEFLSPYGIPGKDIRIEPDSVQSRLIILVDGKQIASYSPEQNPPA